MEQLTIKKVTDLQTAKGDSYKKVDVMKADGTLVAGVSAFKFKYPNQAELVEGAVVTAMIVIDGNYRNLVSAPQTAPRGNSGFKTAQIEKVMEIKRDDIRQSQQNKDLGIKISSTIRMAVDIATSIPQEQWQSTTMQEEIRFWREWLWTEWDQTGSNRMKPF